MLHTDDITVDPHMATHALYGLGLSYVRHPDDALRYLERRIQNHPEDFKSHVKRITLLLRHGKQPNQILGAMVDLFLVLHDKGMGLKRTMLEQAKPSLSKTAYHVLAQYLNQALPLHHAIVVNAGYSLLAQLPPEPTRKLVIRHVADDKTVGAHVLEDAHEYIANGQLDLALDALESSLLADTKQPLVMEMLLGIYRHMKTRDRFDLMSTQFSLQPAGIPHDWLWPADKV